MQCSVSDPNLFWIRIRLVPEGVNVEKNKAKRKISDHKKVFETLNSALKYSNLPIICFKLLVTFNLILEKFGFVSLGSRSAFAKKAGKPEQIVVASSIKFFNLKFGLNPHKVNSDYTHCRKARKMLTD
jgi:hypothetical protein